MLNSIHIYPVFVNENVANQLNLANFCDGNDCTICIATMAMLTKIPG